MIKPNELRLGNWVSVMSPSTIGEGEFSPQPVLGVLKDSIITGWGEALSSTGWMPKYVNPIPLTEEWLLKNTEFYLYETTIHEYVSNVKTKCKYYTLPDDEAEGSDYEFSIVFVSNPETGEIRNVQFHSYGHDISGGNIQKSTVHLLQNTYHVVTGEELSLTSVINSDKT